MKIVFISIFIFSFFTVASQVKRQSFLAIDNRVKAIQSNSPDTLARKLTSPYKNELEKVRSIFRWITENITYDVKGYRDQELYSNLYKSLVSSSDSGRKKEYNNLIVRKVLAERVAVCEGYARLFKTLCDHAKIRSEVVSGYARNWNDPISESPPAKTDHAWNAVMIDRRWYLLDVTWASGSSNNNVTAFNKAYNNFYFLTNPVQFFNNHYPEDRNWILFENAPNLYQFFRYPYYHEDYFKGKVISFRPTEGILLISTKSKKVFIELETDDIKKELFISEYPVADTAMSQNVLGGKSYDELEEHDRPKYKIAGKKISYEYDLQSTKAEKLNIFYNHKLIITYTVSWMK